MHATLNPRWRVAVCTARCCALHPMLHGAYFTGSGAAAPAASPPRARCRTPAFRSRRICSRTQSGATVQLYMQPCNNATMQQCKNATVQQCNSATNNATNNATMRQCNKQCNHHRTQMQQCNSATNNATPQKATITAHKCNNATVQHNHAAVQPRTCPAAHNMQPCSTTPVPWHATRQLACASRRAGRQTTGALCGFRRDFVEGERAELCRHRPSLLGGDRPQERQVAPIDGPVPYGFMLHRCT